MGGLSIPYATTPMNSRAGMTIGGTRYFMVFPIFRVLAWRHQQVTPECPPRQIKICRRGPQHRKAAEQHRLPKLTRLGLDPWEEAARLTPLPKARAAEALAKVIARLPIRRTMIAPGLRPLPPRRSGASNNYRALPSRSAQAVTTAELEASVPGIVAQPPFSMIERRSHDEDTFLNSINFVAASA